MYFSTSKHLLHKDTKTLPSLHNSDNYKKPDTENDKKKCPFPHKNKPLS